jgi:hypothetical protein
MHSKLKNAFLQEKSGVKYRKKSDFSCKNAQFYCYKNKYNIITNLLNFFLKIHLNFALLGI